jgi:hypothetical protein
MRLGMTQFSPDVRHQPEKDVVNSIVHVMVGPLTRLPAKFTTVGIDLYV